MTEVDESWTSGRVALTACSNGHFLMQILTSKVFSANNVSDMADFRSDKPLVISGCNRSEPCIYYVAPVLKLR